MQKLQPSDLIATVSNYLCLSILPVPSQGATDEAFKLLVTAICGLIAKFGYEYVDKKRKRFQQKRISRANKPHSITPKSIDDEKKISEQISSN